MFIVFWFCRNACEHVLEVYQDKMFLPRSMRWPSASIGPKTPDQATPAFFATFHNTLQDRCDNYRALQSQLKSMLWTDSPTQAPLTSAWYPVCALHRSAAECFRICDPPMMAIPDVYRMFCTSPVHQLCVSCILLSVNDDHSFRNRQVSDESQQQSTWACSLRKSTCSPFQKCL